MLFALVFVFLATVSEQGKVIERIANILEANVGDYVQCSNAQVLASNTNNTFAFFDTFQLLSKEQNSAILGYFADLDSFTRATRYDPNYNLLNPVIKTFTCTNVFGVVKMGEIEDSLSRRQDVDVLEEEPVLLKLQPHPKFVPPRRNYTPLVGEYIACIPGTESNNMIQNKFYNQFPVYARWNQCNWNAICTLNISGYHHDIPWILGAMNWVAGNTDFGKACLRKRRFCPGVNTPFLNDSVLAPKDSSCQVPIAYWNKHMVTRPFKDTTIAYLTNCSSYCFSAGFIGA